MDISLTSDIEQFLRNKVANGIYKSINEAINDAINILIIRDSVSEERIKMFNEEIKKGLDDVEAGKVSDGIKFLDELIAEYE